MCQSTQTIHTQKDKEIKKLLNLYVNSGISEGDAEKMIEILLDNQAIVSERRKTIRKTIDVYMEEGYKKDICYKKISLITSLAIGTIDNIRFSVGRNA